MKRILLGSLMTLGCVSLLAISCNVLADDLYCPQQIYCSGATTDTCTSTDSRFKNMLPSKNISITPGFHTFATASGLLFNNAALCIYSSDETLVFESVQSYYTIDQAKTPNNWVEADSWICEASDPYYCPFAIHD